MRGCLSELEARCEELVEVLKFPGLCKRSCDASPPGAAGAVFPEGEKFVKLNFAIFNTSDF